MNILFKCSLFGPGVGTRREGGRKKMPGSLTSSINSSESEQGAGAAAAGGGRRAASAGAANGQRSVYLHAAAVADIPSSEGRPVQV